MEIEGQEEIKKLFEKMLGSKIVIEYDDIDTRKSLFISIISELELLNINENLIFESTNIDLSSITNGYLSIIERLLLLYVGEQAFEIISWYLFHRIAPDGTLIKLENQQGESFEINTPEQLWDFITTKISK